MLSKDSGFHVIEGYDINRYYAIDVQDKYITVASFINVPFGDSPDVVRYEDWADFQEYLETPCDQYHQAGVADTKYAGVIIRDFPLPSKGRPVQCMGRTTFNIEGMIGADEVVDYSLFDLATSPDGSMRPWVNRFAKNLQEKIDTSFRYRARDPHLTGTVIFMPFNVTSLKEARVEILINRDQLILLNDTKPTSYVDGPKVIPENGVWYKNFFYNIEQTEEIEVLAGCATEIPFKMVWGGNNTGTDCKGVVTFKVSELAGYAPIKRVTTDKNGHGSLRVSAVGLVAGEEIVFKINADHFTGLGKLTAKVI